MPEYKCEVCNFVCIRPGAYKEHLKSTKHKANMYESSISSPVIADYEMKIQGMI